MEQQVVFIADTAFKVDIEGGWLVSVDHPATVIAKGDIKDEGLYYTALLNRYSKELFRGYLEIGKVNDDIISVVIPKEIFNASFWQDNLRMEEINRTSLNRDWNILVTDEKWRNNEFYGIDKATGISQNKLPIYTIENTDFIVDVANQELREVGDASNNIHFLDMEDRGTHYILNYHPEPNNLLADFGKPGVEVHVPQMVQLDPEGMAACYGKSVEEIKGKTDFEVIVNQNLVALRQNGILPEIEIAGHPFYVDLQMDCLRPKDDFSSQGIRFSDIDFCYMEEEMMYRITYNPKSRSFVDVDFNSITSVPKELIVVDIPHQCNLDPVGFARKYNMPSEYVLRRHPPQADMKATNIPWEETPVNEIIARNLKNAGKLNLRSHQRTTKRKGRRI